MDHPQLAPGTGLSWVTMDVKALLRRYGLRPSKGLGQNFLTDERVYARILEVSELQADDVVLEIGPGLGTLTRRLAERVSLVVAIELDRQMIAILSDTLRDHPNVHLIQGDVLSLDPVAALSRAQGVPEDRVGAYKVVANLPYYITSAVLRHLLTARLRPLMLTLMVQREVAERIVAPPGQLSLLALSVQVFGRPRIVQRVPATAFYPRPKVDSAVLCLPLDEQPRIAPEQLSLFFRVAQAAFAQRRKQIHNSLRNNLGLSAKEVRQALDEAGIAPHRRPQTLRIEEWARLTQALHPMLRRGDTGSLVR